MEQPQIEFTEQAQNEMGTTAAKELADGFNRMLTAIGELSSRVDTLSTRVQRIERRLWIIITTVGVAAAGMVLGAGAMIFAAVQIMLNF